MLLSSNWRRTSDLQSGKCEFESRRQYNTNILNLNTMKGIATCNHCDYVWYVADVGSAQCPQCGETITSIGK